MSSQMASQGVRLWGLCGEPNSPFSQGLGVADANDFAAPLLEYRNP